MPVRDTTKDHPGTRPVTRPRGRAAWGRAVASLGCAGLAAYARPDPVSMPGVPGTVTSGSGGGARTLGNIPHVTVTTPIGPAAGGTGTIDTATTGATGAGTVAGAGGSAVGAGGSTRASGTSRMGTGIRSPRLLGPPARPRPASGTGGPGPNSSRIRATTAATGSGRACSPHTVPAGAGAGCRGAARGPRRDGPRGVRPRCG